MRVTKTHSAAAGATHTMRVSLLRQLEHDNSATEYHNAYEVDPTVYAATYTASSGASLMGQVKTPSVKKSTGR